MKQYDAIIIGFGKAGKTLAAELSNRGWQVAIVERSNMMYGCPSADCRCRQFSETRWQGLQC